MILQESFHDETKQKNMAIAQRHPGLIRHQDAYKLTYEDYCRVPEDTRVELIDGEFFMSPSPLVSHQDVSASIFVPLYRWVKANKLGKTLAAPMDVLFSEYDVVQPDILFISNERLHVVNRKNIAGAPDLLIEILSPGTAERDRLIKKGLYAKYGVKEYWIVDPKAQTVALFFLRRNQLKHRHTYSMDQIVESRAVRDFKLSVKEIFA